MSIGVYCCVHVASVHIGVGVIVYSYLEGLAGTL